MRSACAKPLASFVFGGEPGENGATVPTQPHGLVEPCWSRDLGGYSVTYRVTQPSHQGAQCCHGLLCASVSFVGAVGICILHIVSCC
jgi:hypothetical protein